MTREELLHAAVEEADRARRLFPQPNPTVLALAEESGEVVKAALDFRNGKATSDDLLGEVKQTIAMCLRLAEEGDPTIGVPPLLTPAPAPVAAPRDYTAEYEALAEAFWQDTGLIAPGKDAPPGLYTDEQDKARERVWRIWLPAHQSAPEACPECGHSRMLHSYVDGECSMCACDRYAPAGRAPAAKKEG